MQPSPTCALPPLHALSPHRALSPLRALPLLGSSPRSLAFGLALLASAVACAGESGVGGGKACTLIGCVDMLTIQPKTPQGSIITLVQGTLVIDGASVAVSCLGGVGAKAAAPRNLNVQCTDQGLQIPGAPSKVIVTLSSGDYAISGEVVEPSYKTSQPNGAGCDPICKQATVAVTLGGGLVDVESDASGDAGVDATPLDGSTQDGAADTTSGEEVTPAG